MVSQVYFKPFSAYEDRILNTLGVTIDKEMIHAYLWSIYTKNCMNLQYQFSLGHKYNYWIIEEC